MNNPQDPQMPNLKAYAATISDDPLTSDSTHGAGQVKNCINCETLGHSCPTHCLCSYCLLKRQAEEIETLRKEIKVLERQRDAEREKNAELWVALTHATGVACSVRERQVRIDEMVEILDKL